VILVGGGPDLDMVETSVTEVGGNKLYVSLHVHTQNCRAIVFSPEESPCSPMTTTTPDTKAAK
jgi:hypothetical protein